MHKSLQIKIAMIFVASVEKTQSHLLKHKLREFNQPTFTQNITLLTIFANLICRNSDNISTRAHVQLNSREISENYFSAIHEKKTYLNVFN